MERVKYMKLYICGNGFDLHHGLQTSYKDYKNFLILEHPDVIGEYEEFVGVYDNSRIAWSNIEDALKIDYLKMLCRFADLPSVVDEIYYRSHENNVISYNGNDLEDAFRGLTNFITNFTGKYLYDWLSSIDTKKVKPDLNLSQDDLYINFNYIDTLQTLYHIPDKNVFHIHGSLKELKGLKKDTVAYKKEFLSWYAPEVGKKEALDVWRIEECPAFQNMYIRQTLQFGAVINKESELQKIKKWYNADEAYASYVEPSIGVIESFIEKSTKKLSSNYKKLTYFAWTHSDIDTIVIMGHTLLGVDFQYYKEILVPFFKDKLWVFKAYNGDTSEINQFLDKTGLDNYRIESW